MSEQLVRLTRDKKRDLMTKIGGLPEALYRIEITRVRPKLTTDQQGYYFAGIVKPFAERIHEDSGGDMNMAEAMESAHASLKERFLAVPKLVDKRTGEVLAKDVPSLMSLDTAQMYEYSEKCAAWLNRDVGVVVLTPNEYYASIGQLPPAKKDFSTYVEANRQPKAATVA
jgi:hypothetical protein